MNPLRITTLVAVLAAALAQAGAAQTLRHSSAVRLPEGETDLSVKVRFGAGEFVLSRETGNALYRGNVVFDERYFTAVNRYGQNHLEIGTRARADLDEIDIEGQRLDLRVSPHVPVSLELEFGAGRAELDLGGLKLDNARISTGASESTLEFSRPTTHACRELTVRVGAADFTATALGNANCSSLNVSGAAGSLTLDFTGEWQVTEMRAGITLGLGGMTLRFPQDLGVAIRLNRFLASFDHAGFTKRGDTYYSRGFDDAPAHLNIELRAIVGDVRVEWVEGR